MKISFKGGPQLTVDVKQGSADLVITGTGQVDNLSRPAKAGASKPDVSTPNKLKAALLAAKTVGYSQGASGQHFVTVLPEARHHTDAVRGQPPHEDTPLALEKI